MELTAGLWLTVEDRPADADCDAIEDALTEFNRPHLRDPTYGRIAVFVRDAASVIMAGLDASFYAGWLYVNNLWVSAELRGRGLGRSLLAEAERRAVARGCHSAWLDTFSFQAPDFYRRLGYEVFGVLDYPPDHRRFFLKKRLSAETG